MRKFVFHFLLGSVYLFYAAQSFGLNRNSKYDRAPGESISHASIEFPIGLILSRYYSRG